MPRSQKPIICICGSRTIDYVNLDMFITPEHCGEIISGDAIGIDSLVKNWAFKHKIEYIEFKSNYEIWGDSAPFERNKDMVRFCDVVIAFWDGKSVDTARTFNFAKQLNKQIFIHKIESTD